LRVPHAGTALLQRCQHAIGPRKIIEARQLGDIEAISLLTEIQQRFAFVPRRVKGNYLGSVVRFDCID
jgi:hypothetical protein